MRRYRRWRHGRGFGVHSPFAYRFIIETLRERLPYYGYDCIEALACGKGYAPEKRVLRLVFRIIVRFTPRTVCVADGVCADVWRKVVAVAAPRAAVGDSGVGADFFIIGSAGAQLPLVDSAVYVFAGLDGEGAARRDELWAAVEHGMRFDNNRGVTVVVTSPKLPRHAIEARF